MTATAVRGAELETNLTDMSHFAIAQVNDGVFQNGRILMPASVESMQSTHYMPYSLLPGAAYGFTEMRRHAWRALQHDGAAGDFASRLVIVPEARLGYFIVVQGAAGPEFWRALDNGLFDRLLPAQGHDVRATPAGAPAPTQADAEAMAGPYESIRTLATDAAPLKLGGRFTARAGGSGELILTGSPSATLTPRPGGYWGSADGNLIAVPVMGNLMLSTGTYGRLALYKRPGLYLALALLALIAAGGLFIFERHGKQPRRLPVSPVLGLAGAGTIFALLSAVLWLLSPGA
jgi:hypothetical protein